jgi:hypothetical protein
MNYVSLFKSYRHADRALVLLSLLWRSVFVDVPIRAIVSLD